MSDVHEDEQPLPSGPASLVGYLSNRRDRLQTTLEREGSILGPQTIESPMGYGLGFYQNAEVLHKKRPRSEGGTFNWGEVASSVNTDCAIMHLRMPTVGTFRAENTHPFRMRSWLFAHLGTIPAFETLGPKLQERVPDFIRRNMRGQTDSELLFHVVLSFLHDGGALDDSGGLNPQGHEEKVLAAISESVSLVDALCMEVDAPQPSLTLMLTDGRALYALCRGEPLCWVTRRFSGVGSQALSTEHRYVLVLGGVASPSNDYNQAAQSHVLVVGRDLSARIVPVS